MCLILDTNRFGPFLDRGDKDMAPVRDWIENRNGKIAWSPTRGMRGELERYGKMKDEFIRYRRAGKLKLIDEAAVTKEMKTLPELRSNDTEIIALARAAGVGLLVSADRNLHADFKEIIKGRIYQTRSHRRLLRPDACP